MRVLFRRGSVEAITAVLIVSLLANGCATKALWHENETYHPTDSPDLKLASGVNRRDVFVEYKEQRGEAPKFQWRAYWLFGSTNSIAKRGRPVFVDPKEYARLAPIPLLGENTGTNASALAGFAAVATPAEQGFDLWQDGKYLGRYYLPIYAARARPTFLRVAATPFAALNDTVVVIVLGAAVIAIVVGVLYLDSKSS